MAGPNTCLQDRLVVIDSHPYAVIHRRWPSFSGCCGSCLEQSIAARHIRAVTASLPQSPQDTSLQALCFPWLCCCAWEVTSSFSDTLIVFVVVSYLPSCTHYDDTTWKYCIHLAQNALFLLHTQFWVEAVTPFPDPTLNLLALWHKATCGRRLLMSVWLC